jgi:Uma2 family endonuclease
MFTYLVDLKNQQLKVFREPINGNYARELTFTCGEISPLAFPEIKISIELLLHGF